MSPSLLVWTHCHEQRQLLALQSLVYHLQRKKEQGWRWVLGGQSLRDGRRQQNSEEQGGDSRKDQGHPLGSVTAPCLPLIVLPLAVGGRGPFEL